MREVSGDLPGHDRETIAASIQKVRGFHRTIGALVAARSGARQLALAGGLFANVRLNRLPPKSPLDEVFIFPAMGDDGLSVGAALTFLHARDGTETWLRIAIGSTRLSRPELRRRIDDMLRPPACGGSPAGRSRPRSI